MLGRLGRLFDCVLDACGAVAMALLALIALAIGYDVVSRRIGLYPVPWVIEAVEYALLVVTFAAAPWVLKRAAHVRVDIVVEQLPPRWRQGCGALADLVGLGICLVIAYYGLVLTGRAYEAELRIFRTLTVMQWWVFSVVPVSAVLMALEFVRRLWRRAGGRSPDAPPRAIGV